MSLADFAHGQRSNALRKQKREADPAYDKLFRERAQEVQFKRRYGITRSEAAAMYEQQKGQCAICCEPGACPTTLSTGSHSKLNVDHCHTTNKVRGLLCAHCNIGLGKFKDDLTNLMRAFYYVRNF